MRTLGFRTHVLLAIAGAIGVMYSLSRPWYAAAPPPPKEDDAGIGDIHGPLNRSSTAPSAGCRAAPGPPAGTRWTTGAR